MMSKTLGAPLGGTTVGGQYGLESLEPKLIVPPNGAGGGGRYLPSIVVVALGEPGVPVGCCPAAGRTDIVATTASAASGSSRMLLVVLMVPSVHYRCDAAVCARLK